MVKTMSVHGLASWSMPAPSRTWGQSTAYHQAHEPLDPLAIDGIAVAPQHPRHAPRAQEGPRRERLSDKSDLSKSIQTSYWT
jgi:hypothetical protein